ncbi:MAG: hypothetical protein SFW67_19765 [Myxococcaceae bacterium]|nr:hypothetical protein [Myxococcaceae bacterium]
MSLRWKPDGGGGGVAVPELMGFPLGPTNAPGGGAMVPVLMRPGPTYDGGGGGTAVPELIGPPLGPTNAPGG